MTGYHNNSDKHDILNQILNDIATEEIPDDMSLWTDIRDELEQKPSRPVWGMLTLTRLAAMVLIVTVSAAAYGFYQQFGANDPGLDNVEQAGLVTEIGEAQRDNGLTVTLNWAYADEHRVSFNYTAEADDATPLRGMMTQARLVDASGEPIGIASFGMGGSPDPNIPFGGTINFDTVEFDTPPDELSLTLEMRLARDTTIDPTAEGGGYGGGFGGGGNGEIPVDAEGFHPLMSGFEVLGRYSFDFTVPFIPADVVEINQTNAANGVNVTLNKVSIAPSMTEVHFCHDLPSEENWTMQLALDTGGDTLDFTRYGHDDANSTPEQTCTIASYPIAPNQDAATWTFSVQRFEGEADFTAEEYEAAMAERGIEGVEVDVHENGFSIGITVPPPDGLDVNQIQMEVMDSFREVKEGPWAFEINLP